MVSNTALTDLSFSALINLFISLKTNNQGSITLTHNPVYYTPTRHIDIQKHYIHDKVTTGQINLQYITTFKIIADALTKAFTNAKFHIFDKQMNIN